MNGLKTAPGRKAIVFFSEGLVLPPRVAGTLRTVVAEANRGGVTFYAADAAGLRTVSSASETRRDLASIAQVLENPDSAKPGELMKAHRAQRGHPALRPHERALDTGPGDRRLPRDRHELDRALAAGGRGGPRLLLPPGVRPGQRALGRPLPPHRGEGAEAGRPRPGPAGLLRGADRDADAAPRLRVSRPRRARDGPARERPRLPLGRGPGARPGRRERGADPRRGGGRRADAGPRRRRRSGTGRTSRCSSSCATRGDASCGS